MRMLSMDLTSDLGPSRLPSCLTRQNARKVRWSNAAWQNLPDKARQDILTRLELHSFQVSLLPLSGSLSGATLSIQPWGTEGEALLQLWPSVSQSISIHSPFVQRLRELGSVAARCLAYDWSGTALGELSTWSASLQSATYLTLSSDYPAALWLAADDSDKLLLLHNDAFGAQFASMDVFGAAAMSGFGNQYAKLEARYNKVLLSKKAVMGIDQVWIFPDRNGKSKEMFFDDEWLPLFDDDGSWLGVFNKALETSEKVHGRRDLDTIARVTSATATARTIDAFCSSFAEAVSVATPYFPFVLLYTSELESGLPGELTKTSTARCLTRRGACGVPQDHEWAPHLVQLHAPSAGSISHEEDGGSLLLSNHIIDASELPWEIGRVMQGDTPLLVPDSVDIRTRFHAQSDRAIVYPIKGHRAVEGVLIFGLHPLRPFADSYANLANVLAQNVDIGLAKAVIFEQSETQSSRLQDLERLKSVFFTTISDELQTPISLILAPLSGLMENKELSPQHKKSIRTASRSALHLMNLFGVLLDYFRLQQGVWTPVFRLVHLQRLTTQIVHQLLASMRSTDGPRLTVKAEEVEIHVDPLIYEKMLLLVIGAMMRVSNRRSQYAIDIHLSSTHDGAQLVVTRRKIEINGDMADSFGSQVSVPGLLNTEQFDHTTSSFDKLGLARSLLKDFVRLLRGQMVQKQGVGEVRFEVSLPTKARAALDSERVLDEASDPKVMQPRFVYAAAVVSEDSNNSDEASDSSGGVGSAARFPDIDAMFSSGDMSVRESTICLADGNSEMRAFCRDALAYFSRVVEARNAEEALFRVTGDDVVDLLIINADLPGINTWALIAALREIGSEIPVIVLSARSGGEAQADSLMAGAAELLVKPFSERELLVKACSQIQAAKVRTSLRQRIRDQTHALNRSETRADDLDQELKAIANAAPVGLCTLNETGKILYANRKWLEVTGLPPDTDLDWLSHLVDSDRSRVQENIKRLLVSQTPCEITARWCTGRQTLLSFESWQMSGQTLRFVGSVVDVTELRRLENAELVAVQERADDAERMRQFQELSVDVFSHELRNPLSAISQAAGLLGDDLEQMATEADQRLVAGAMAQDTHEQLIRHLIACDETLHAIKSCAQHQRRIADDILNFSKLNMRLLSLSKQPLDLVKFAESVLKMFDSEARSLNIRLKFVCDESLTSCDGRHVVADPHRLGQVLINFLTNAMRYSADAKDRKILVTLAASSVIRDARNDGIRVLPDEGLPELEEDSLWIKLAVQDRGRGLSRAEQESLFKRFGQARPTIDGLSGSGLGLFISKSIIHLHGGFVEIASTPGQSTTFSFCIPARRATASEVAGTPWEALTPHMTSLSQRHRPARDMKSPSLVSSGQSSPLTSPPLSAPQTLPFGRRDTVLVVDDSTINVKLLEKQLQKRGFRVETGSNGQEALTLVEASRGRLLGLCLDVAMPVMDGMTAVAELRRREQAAGLDPLFVLAVTGNAREGQRKHCLEAGYSAVVTKPYTIEEVEQLIRGANSQ